MKFYCLKAAPESTFDSMVTERRYIADRFTMHFITTGVHLKSKNYNYNRKFSGCLLHCSIKYCVTIFVHFIPKLTCPPKIVFPLPKADFFWQKRLIRDCFGRNSLHFTFLHSHKKIQIEEGFERFLYTQHESKQ